MVALTLDSGGVAGATARVLDVLRERRLQVTIFVTGEFTDKYPDLVKRMAQDGHQISNHSYSHRDFTTLTNNQILEEMQTAEAAILRVTGRTSKPYMRMPFGARNSRVNETVSGAGYRSIYWTLDSGDWREGATAAGVAQRVLGNVGPGYIVVHHTAADQTADALPEIIKGIQAKGLSIVTVSRLLGDGPRAQALRGDLLVHVNKNDSLAADYAPPDLVEISGVSVTRQGMKLREEALQRLKEMVAPAKGEGLELVVLSAYRSYAEQEQIYGRELVSNGQAQADRFVARPGHSEHQLGTTVDFTSPSAGYGLSQSFGETPEGRWLRDNAHRFGYVMSYPQGKESITGYAYEPWHFRYVGVKTAAEVYRLGLTLEEYLRSD